MVRYVVYDSSGNIVKFGACRERDVHLQAGPGQHVMEVPAGAEHFNDLDFRVIDGKLEKRPQEEIASRIAAKVARIKVRMDQATKRDEALADIIEGKIALGLAIITLAKILKGEL